MQAIRDHLAHTQRHYVHASKTIGSAIGRFSAAPGECMSAIERVSADSASVILADMDSAIVLITDKAHHDGFAAHALSVMTLSLLLARQARLPEEALRTLGVGALLHDIGELDLNPSIVRNMERGRHEESAYRAHCTLGAQRLRDAGNVHPAVVQAALSHHEAHDGSGFPQGLSGDTIPVAARVVAIANRFDNLVNPIDVRRAVSPSEALSLMWVREKRCFDPVLLQLFVRAVGVYPPGTIVQLTDGRVGAVVLSASIEDPLSPQVLVYEPEVTRSHAIIVDLAQDRSVRIDRSLRLADRPAEELDYLLPRRRMGWFLDMGEGA